MYDVCGAPLAQYGMRWRAKESQDERACVAGCVCAAIGMHERPCWVEHSSMSTAVDMEAAASADALEDLFESDVDTDEDAPAGVLADAAKDAATSPVVAPFGSSASPAAEVPTAESSTACGGSRASLSPSSARLAGGSSAVPLDVMDPCLGSSFLLSQWNDTQPPATFCLK